MTTLVLASTSPARLTLLRSGGIEPVTIAPGVDEDLVADRATTAGLIANTADMVHILAKAKAEAVIDHPHARGAIIIGCDSSLEFDGAISMLGDKMTDHPIDVLYDLGFKVTVNTDNRLMSGTSLTRELELLVDAFGYNLGDLELFQINAAEAAFQAIEDREELIEMITEGFDQAGR